MAAYAAVGVAGWRITFLGLSFRLPYFRSDPRPPHTIRTHGLSIVDLNFSDKNCPTTAATFGSIAASLRTDSHRFDSFAVAENRRSTCPD